MIHTSKSIEWIIEQLRTDQTSDGSWNYPFETGISTDAYMIILLQLLEINDEQLIQNLAARILSRQEDNGAWKLFYDEGDGNLSATAEAYYALSFYFDKNDRRLQAAKRFVLENGGLEKVSSYTKIMLALTGQYDWPAFSPFPVEMILLPLSFPINFYQFSTFGRANLAPIMVLADKKFTIQAKHSLALSDLKRTTGSKETWKRLPEWDPFFSMIEEGINSLGGLKEQLHSLAIERAKKYIFERIEQDGTFSSYFSSTFLMIFVLLSFGYSNDHPTIVKAIEGLKSMKSDIHGYTHMQYTTASVWNTSLISYALQSAQISPQDPMLEKANRYLLSRQHHKWGDWVIHNRRSMPGGWGFSDINTNVPDVDDTTASLRAIAREAQATKSQYLSSWERGIRWFLSMQNNDGGWPAFERNQNNQWLSLLPVEKGGFLLSDPSCADLTGRALEFIGNFTDLPNHDQLVMQGVKWLLQNQEKDGSWYGRWGICYLYGTWAAVTGLLSVGVALDHTSIEKATAWLKRIQNKDGGWGESCRSDSQKTYVPLEASTLTHTSWALDTLISAADQPTAEIQRGMTFLTKSLSKKDWTTDYPAGQGMAGSLYIHYHSYRYIFPLLALAHYKQKFE